MAQCISLTEALHIAIIVIQTWHPDLRVELLLPAVHVISQPDVSVGKPVKQSYSQIQEKLPQDGEYDAL